MNKRKTNHSALMPLVILLMTVGCFSADAELDGFIGQSGNEVEGSTTLSISVTSPASETKRVGYLTKISGLCAPAGKTVQISGDATGFTACGLGGTWEAFIDFSGANAGAVSVSVTLVDGDRTSVAATKGFVKDSTDCDSASARADTFANSSTGGDGAGTPYHICTSSQLSNVNNNTYAGSNFELKNDIYLFGVTFQPISTNYNGTFEGNNFTIADLSVSQTGDNYGLFRYLRNSGIIRNITLENVSVSGRHQIGGLVGRMYETASVSGITVSGTIDGTGNNVGGVIGYVDTSTGVSIQQVTSSTTVSGNSSIGGVLGSARNTAVVFMDEAIGTGDITGVSNVGGVVGNAGTDSFTTEDSYATGTIRISGSNGGGLFGYLRGSIDRSYATGTLIASAGSYHGGFAGRTATNSNVRTCYATGAVSSVGRYVGGLIGYFEGPLVSDSYATGAVSSTYDQNTVGIGGLVGNSRANTTYSNVYATGNVTTAAERAGGLIGEFVGGLIQTCYATGNVTGTSTNVARPAHYLGGLIGYGLSTNADIRDCYATGNVLHSATSVVNANQIGGLAGRFDGLNVQNSYATGNVTNLYGGDYIGGVFGYTRGHNVSMTIDNTYGTGVVLTPGRYAGGFAGYIQKSNTASSNMTVTNSYATGSVTSTSTANETYVGGFSGSIYAHQQAGTLTITDSYATGAVVANNRRVAGFVGDIYMHDTGSNMTLRRIYSTGTVGVTDSGSNVLQYVGGLVGHFQARSNAGTFTLDDVYSTSVITLSGGPQHYIGGLMGTLNAGNSVAVAVSAARATQASISGDGNYIAGLMGYFYAGNNSTITMTTSYSTANVTGGGQYVGGLIGLASGGSSTANTITNSYAWGNVSATRTGDTYAGGLIGSTNARTVVQNSYATGDVNAPNANYVGGLTGGRNAGAMSFSGSFAAGDVTGSRFVGGFIGRQGNGDMTDCFASGDVNGVRDVGGFVGHHRGDNNDNTNLYAAGAVTRTSGTNTAFGEVVGNSDDASDWVNVYWKSDNAIGFAHETQGNGSSISPGNMLIQGSYGGFTFPGTWTMPAAGYQLPNTSVNYEFAIPSWL